MNFSYDKVNGVGCVNSSSHKTCFKFLFFYSNIFLLYKHRSCYSWDAKTITCRSSRSVSVTTDGF